MIPMILAYIKTKLSKKECEPCEGKVEPFSKDEIKEFQSLLKMPWTVVENKKIRKEFTFKKFTDSISFVNRVANVAEQEDHHPDIEINYNKVTITLWTHAINGLSENDFILAAKIDEIK